MVIFLSVQARSFDVGTITYDLLKRFKDATSEALAK
jgi:hypothetical protein